MSAGAHSISTQSRGPDLLGELLHFMSQPLTTLHCALESSIAQETIAAPEDVCLALDQTDRVIEAVRLMREYLEAEQPCPFIAPVALDPAIHRALDQLAVVAEARGVRLSAEGATNAMIHLGEARLDRILIYMIGILIESAPLGAEIMLSSADGPFGSVLSGHIPADPCLVDKSLVGRPSAERSLVNHSSTGHHPGGLLAASALSVLWQAKISIAQRALESSGSSVEFCLDDKPGFTVRIPPPAPPLPAIGDPTNSLTV
ncbi:MAG: hypothetical protein WBW53_02430 [Terriglobales bacterium]